MLDRFQAHLEQSGLIPSGARVLVGYSGGADSTCLLHLLHACGVDVVAGHLHHGQRPEADKELRLCEAFATSLDIPFASGRADVPEISRQMKVGLEEAGREARYHFFRQAAYRLECSLVATGHTLDDQAETVILHLARGSGISGMGGIPARREDIVRPLLPFSREETRAYCEAHGFWYHDDPANDDVSFSRSRIRHRVMPELRTLNPSVAEAIARLAATAQEEDAFLNGAAAAALEQAEVPLNGDLRFLTLDVEASFVAHVLRHYPAPLLKRAVRLAAQAVGGALSFEQTQLVFAGVRDGGKGSITCEGGAVAVEWTPEAVTVREVSVTEPFRHPLTVPGETISDEFGWKFEAFPVHQSDAPVRQSLAVDIDAGVIRGPLYFRTAESRDQMTPLGFDHRRKLSDLLSEAKLTQAARRRLPIVCDLIGPLWAPGVCLDERARPSGGDAIRLRLLPVSNHLSENTER